MELCKNEKKMVNYGFLRKRIFLKNVKIAILKRHNSVILASILMRFFKIKFWKIIFFLGIYAVYLLPSPQWPSNCKHEPLNIRANISFTIRPPRPNTNTTRIIKLLRLGHKNPLNKLGSILEKY